MRHRRANHTVWYIGWAGSGEVTQGESVRPIIWALDLSKHDKTATAPFGLSTTGTRARMPYAVTTKEGIPYHAGGS